MTDDLPPPHPTALDLAGIAGMLDVTEKTVKRWRTHGVYGRAFPAPKWTINDGPVWDRLDVKLWSSLTLDAMLRGAPQRA